MLSLPMTPSISGQVGFFLNGRNNTAFLLHVGAGFCGRGLAPDEGAPVGTCVDRPTAIGGKPPPTKARSHGGLRFYRWRAWPRARRAASWTASPRVGWAWMV